MTNSQRVAIVGAGAWGTALASVARRAGCGTTLWAHEAEVAAAINERNENTFFLPGIALDPAIAADTDLAAIAGADAVFLATPAQHLREIARRAAASLGPSTPIVICAKGIEQSTGKLMSAVAAEMLPGRPSAVLAGPTFAAEIARGLPAAVTLAASDRALAERVAMLIGGPHFRPYVSDDPIGAQVGGAVKNVLAIACGVVTGRGLGDNARAALVTRGLAEMVRLGVALGGRAETLMGLSGLGDLVLTCCGMQSRNLTLGVALGEGRRLADVLGERNTVAEGVHSAGAIARAAAGHGVEMPIVSAVDAILNQGADIDAVTADLLARPFRREAAGFGAV